MAIVISIDKSGEKSYKSAQPKLLSEEEILQADRLNNYLEKQISSYVKADFDKNQKKDLFSFYYNLGKMLRHIFFETNLVNPTEKDLFFINVRLHMDHTGIFPKNDLKRKRNIPKQFFALAGFPYEQAKKVNWSQWSYLFDNVYLMESTGFEAWFTKVLKSNKYSFNESFTRLWAESFNLLFKKVDLGDWSEAEFLKPLNATLEIIQRLKAKGINIDSREIRRTLKRILTRILNRNRSQFILMQMNNLSQEDYIELIVEETQKEYSNL